MPEIIQLIEKAFEEKGYGRVEMPPIEEKIIACNLGLALDDMAVAPTIYHRAKDMGIGIWLPF